MHGSSRNGMVEPLSRLPGLGGCARRRLIPAARVFVNSRPRGGEI